MSSTSAVVACGYGGPFVVEPETREYMSHPTTKLLSRVVLGLLGLALLPQLVQAREVANPASYGVISGKVTADQG